MPSQGAPCLDGPTLYQVLRVDILATQEQIRQAYRRLALVLHPDRRHGDLQQFVEVKAAAETLLDPALRAAYDERVLDKVLVDMEDYLQRFKDLLLTIQGLGLPVHVSSTRCCPGAPGAQRQMLLTLQQSQAAH